MVAREINLGYPYQLSRSKFLKIREKIAKNVVYNTTHSVLNAERMNPVLEVVALSGGKDSTALALRLRELNPDIPYVFVCTPTGDEAPTMIEHWLHLGRLLGSPIVPVTCGASLDGLIRRQNALPNWRQRWCTRMLKIEPYAKWLSLQTNFYGRVVSHVGLREDEPDREGGDYLDVPGVEMKFDMRDWKWKLPDVLGYLQQRGVSIPVRTDCLKCFYQRLIEWYEFWRDHREAWMQGEALEASTGHTFRSPGRDTWPAAMIELRKLFEAGKIPKDTRKPFGDACRVCRL